jgi:hypothetical protein
VNQQSLELARQAVTLLREVLADGPELLNDSDSQVTVATHGLAVQLLRWRVDPVDLEHDLAAMDGVLVDRLADELLENVDFDRFDWST